MNLLYRLILVISVLIPLASYCKMPEAEANLRKFIVQEFTDQYHELASLNYKQRRVVKKILNSLDGSENDQNVYAMINSFYIDFLSNEKVAKNVLEKSKKRFSQIGNSFLALNNLQKSKPATKPIATKPRVVVQTKKIYVKNTDYFMTFVVGMFLICIWAGRELYIIRRFKKEKEREIAKLEKKARKAYNDIKKTASNMVVQTSMTAICTVSGSGRIYRTNDAFDKLTGIKKKSLQNWNEYFRKHFYQVAISNSLNSSFYQFKSDTSNFYLVHVITDSKKDIRTYELIKVSSHDIKKIAVFVNDFTLHNKVNLKESFYKVISEAPKVSACLKQPSFKNHNDLFVDLELDKVEQMCKTVCSIAHVAAKSVQYKEQVTFDIYRMANKHILELKFTAVDFKKEMKKYYKYNGKSIYLEDYFRDLMKQVDHLDIHKSVIIERNDEHVSTVFRFELFTDQMNVFMKDSIEFYNSSLVI